MKSTVSGIPQLPLLHQNHRVHFICKTMQQIESEANEQLHFPHRHDYYSIIWVEKAKGVHHIDFRSYPIDNQTIFFVSPEQVHHLQILGKPIGRVFLFTAEFLESNGIPQHFLAGLELFFACDEVKPIRLKRRQVNEIRLYADEIFREFQHEQYLKQESIAAWLKLMLITCKRIKAENSSLAPASLTSTSKIVKDFKTALEANYAGMHKVSEYAALQHLSSNYLNEVIKEETGKSAKDLIQDRIMLEAKRLATHADLSLKETAYQLGFDDPSHFSKFFSNRNGTDFTTFRNQIRKKYL